MVGLKAHLQVAAEVIELAGQGSKNLGALPRGRLHGAGSQQDLAPTQDPEARGMRIPTDPDPVVANPIEHRVESPTGRQGFVAKVVALVEMVGPERPVPGVIPVQCAGKIRPAADEFQLTRGVPAGVLGCGKKFLDGGADGKPRNLAWQGAGGPYPSQGVNNLGDSLLGPQVLQSPQQTSEASGSGHPAGTFGSSSSGPRPAWASRAATARA